MVMVPEGPGTPVRRGAGRYSVGVGLAVGVDSTACPVVTGTMVSVAEAVPSLGVGVAEGCWVEVGCAPVGCVLLGFGRVVWTGPGYAPEVEVEVDSGGG